MLNLSKSFQVKKQMHLGWRDLKDCCFSIFSFLAELFHLRIISDFISKKQSSSSDSDMHGHLSAHRGRNWRCCWLDQRVLWSLQNESFRPHGKNANTSHAFHSPLPLIKSPVQQMGGGRGLPTNREGELLKWEATAWHHSLMRENWVLQALCENSSRQTE